MKTAINQLPYQAALKVGLQFKRRFWEQDDQIYGGHHLYQPAQCP